MTPKRINLVLLAATAGKCGVLLFFKHSSLVFVGMVFGFGLLGLGLGHLCGRLAAGHRLHFFGDSVELEHIFMFFFWMGSLLGLLSAIVATPWSFLPEVMLVPAAMACLRSARMKPHDAGALFS